LRTQVEHGAQVFEDQRSLQQDEQAARIAEEGQLIPMRRKVKRGNWMASL
jgi:hypothetical protein